MSWKKEGREREKEMDGLAQERERERQRGERKKEGPKMCFLILNEGI